MKIIFICGSLEAGRDGVGDYTRKLAEELINQGNQVAIIALNDRHLKKDIPYNFEYEFSGQLNTLRLSTQFSWKKRIEMSSKLIHSFNPDWVSLQYVPYSFQLKGLPINLGRVVKQLSAGRRIHIMFHELWLGMSVTSSNRHILWGWMQRQLTKLLINRLHPEVIHTQNLLYQIYLNKIGAKALHLPLFSNIPVSTKNPLEYNQISYKLPDKINFVFFGGIHPGAPVKHLAKEVATYATDNNIDISLTIIGRNSQEQKFWSEVWRSQGLNVNMLGEQTPEKVSAILNESSIGLSTTPAVLSGKSGSIAAMHAHGLPVLCVSEPWQPRKVIINETMPGILEYSIGNLAICIENKDKLIPIYTTVNEVAQQFITELSFEANQISK